MVGPQGLLPEGQGPLIEGLGLGLAPPAEVERSQVIEALRDLGVVGAQRLLPEGQGPLIEGLGLGIAPLGIVEHGQVVEALRDLGMVGPKACSR